MDQVDVAVIGAGFGGLAAGVELARRGASVAIYERLNYPGGCASTFTRRGYRFESGATLFSGFAPGQLFHDWIEQMDLKVEFEPLDPVVELRSADFSLPIPNDRQELVERFAALEGVPRGAIAQFFARQEEIAQALWELFDDPSLLPPFDAAALLRHLGRSPKYLGLVPLLGQPLSTIVKRWGAGGIEPLRVYLDAVCQITVQGSSAEIEAPFALAAMDYYFRGTGHIRGGIGQLAWALLRAIEAREGQAYLTDEVKKLRYDPRQRCWQIESRRRKLQARAVIANLLPSALAGICDLPLEKMPHLQSLHRKVETGWGAAMLYLAIEPDAPLPPQPKHIECVHDTRAPFIEGNHIFCSISGLGEHEDAPEGRRSATVSTHVPMKKLRAMPEADRAEYIEDIQQRMRQTLAARIPELEGKIAMQMPASPRTFERFTGRPGGFVGGIPRRVGLGQYTRIFPRAMRPGLYMVGDTVFPGQSTLACALGGVKTAERVLAEL